MQSKGVVIDVGTLHYFVEVARQQSSACAAEKLFVTQPTTSKTPKNLEDELNCILLIRDDRRLFLADTGRAVSERGLALLAEFWQPEAEPSGINQLRTGVLRLGIPPIVGMLTTGPIGLFRQCYPGAELKISELGGLTIQQAVMNGELDMVLTTPPVEESGLTTLSLFGHSLYVLTSRSGKWLECDAVSPGTLAGHPLLTYNEDFALGKQLMKLFDEHDIKPGTTVCSGQQDFLAAMVQTGVGVTMLPESICQRSDKDTLKWLPLESGLSWKLGMIWREGVYLFHSVHAWLSYCEGCWLTPE